MKAKQRQKALVHIMHSQTSVQVSTSRQATTFNILANQRRTAPLARYPATMSTMSTSTSSSVPSIPRLFQHVRYALAAGWPISSPIARRCASRSISIQASIQIFKQIQKATPKQLLHKRTMQLFRSPLSISSVFLCFGFLGFWVWVWLSLSFLVVWFPSGLSVCRFIGLPLFFGLWVFGSIGLSVYRYQSGRSRHRYRFLSASLHLRLPPVPASSRPVLSRPVLSCPTHRVLLASRLSLQPQRILACRTTTSTSTSPSSHCLALLFFSSFFLLFFPLFFPLFTAPFPLRNVAHVILSFPLCVSLAVSIPRSLDLSITLASFFISVKQSPRSTLVVLVVRFDSIHFRWFFPTLFLFLFLFFFLFSFFLLSNFLLFAFSPVLLLFFFPLLVFSIHVFSSSLFSFSFLFLFGSFCLLVSRLVF